MENKIVKNSNNQLSIVNDLISKAKNYTNYNYSENTKKSYQFDWKHFCEWCNEHNFEFLPSIPQVLTLYITYLADNNYKVSSMERKIYAINKYHKMAKLPLDLKDENFRLVWSGIRRKLGTVRVGKDPLLIKTLRQILEIIPDNTVFGIRDRALLSFGWASAMRRSEIIALNWQDIEYIDEGLKVTIRNSKTDKFNEGQKIAIFRGKNKITCPIENLKEWKEISYNNDQALPIFTAISKSGNIKRTRLSGIDVARIIKKYINEIGLDFTNFAGHSLRSGLITTASKHSVPDHVIMKHTRHKDRRMIEVYTRDKSLTIDNVTSMVGL